MYLAFLMQKTEVNHRKTEFSDGLGGNNSGEIKNCYNAGILNRTDEGKTSPISRGLYTKNCYALSGTANTEQSV